MSSTPPSPSQNRLDLRLILETPLRQFAPWLAAVVVVTFAGYPGVVCVTPLAWLIALRVGIVCVTRSKSEPARRRLQEAALAGAWFGVLAGILFWLVSLRMGPIQEDEQAMAVLLSLGMLGVGMLAGAGMSVFTASLIERRRNRGDNLDEIPLD